MRNKYVYTEITKYNEFEFVIVYTKDDVVKSCVNCT